jgi:hypothetical protein
MAPMFLAQRCRLLDNKSLRNQLTSLERSITSTVEKVDHPKTSDAHDDLAAATCLAMVIAGVRSNFDQSFPFANRADWYGHNDAAKQTTKPPTAPKPVEPQFDWPGATGSQRTETYDERIRKDREDAERRLRERADRDSYLTSQLYRGITWGRF